jgi:hypothetical protein
MAVSAVSPGKSLAPYRDCLGREGPGMVRGAGRGSFDRGDLKEAAGGASRAMEPRVCFWGFDTGRIGRWTRKEAGSAALEASKGAGAGLKRHSGLKGSAAEGNRVSRRDTSAPAPEGT